MPTALEHIRVIDFGQYIAGPLAGMLLADQGADVVRLDPPGGPLWDTPANATWNRGKRSIALDLKSPDDLAVARRLVAGADVVVENFRPGGDGEVGIGASGDGGGQSAAGVLLAAWVCVGRSAGRDACLGGGGGCGGCQLPACGTFEQGGAPAGVYGDTHRVDVCCVSGCCEHRTGTERAGAGWAGPAY